MHMFTKWWFSNGYNMPTSPCCCENLARTSLARSSRAADCIVIYRKGRVEQRMHLCVYMYMYMYTYTLGMRARNRRRAGAHGWDGQRCFAGCRPRVRVWRYVYVLYVVLVLFSVESDTRCAVLQHRILPEVCVCVVGVFCVRPCMIAYSLTCNWLLLRRFLAAPKTTTVCARTFFLFVVFPCLLLCACVCVPCSSV